MLDRHDGSFNGLVRDYTLSPEFGKLRESTQKEYRRMLTKAEAEFGNMPLAALDDDHVKMTGAPLHPIEILNHLEYLRERSEGKIGYLRGKA